MAEEQKTWIRTYKNSMRFFTLFKRIILVFEIPQTLYYLPFILA